MNNLLNYLLEANIILVVSGLIYAVFLQNDHQFHWRRVFVLLAIICTCIVPLIHVSGFLGENLKSIGNFPAITLPEIIIGNTNHSGSTTGIVFNWTDFLILIYTVIVLILTLRFITQIRSITRILKDQTLIRVQEDNYVLLQSEGKYPTFSFFKYLVINESDGLKPSDRKQIIAHELVHIEQRHSLDMIALEMLTIFFWFNPVSWYFKKAQVENHEYLADTVASQTHDPISYQNLLIRMTMEQMGYVGHYFSKIETLKRINMMNVKTKKSSKWKIAVVSAALLTVISFVACNDDLINMVDSAQMVAEIPADIQRVMSDLHSKYPNEKFVYTEFDAPKDGMFDLEKLGLNPNTIQHVQALPDRNKLGVVMATNEDFQRLVEHTKSADGVYDIVEEQPEPIGGMGEFYKFIGQNMTYPKASRASGVEGRVFIQFIIGVDGKLKDFVIMKGIDDACNAEAIRVLSIAPSWKPGKQSGEEVEVRMILPITFSFGGNKEETSNGKETEAKTKSMDEMVIVGQKK